MIRFKYYTGFLIQLFLLVIITFSTSGQNTHLNYKVVYKNDKIGWIKLQKIDSASTSSMKLESDINLRVIFLISVIEMQQALFTGGIMMTSYMYRKVNRDVKMNKHTVYKGSYYEVKDKKSSAQVMIKNIQYNLLSMYFKEPVNISQVYSDSFQRYLTIEAKPNSSYKIALPDGNNNFYYYKNGVCSRIVVEHSLFTIEFIRV